MKRYTFSTKALSFSIILSCGMFFPQIIEAQKANKILDLLQQGKISKAVEKRNRVYSNDGAKEFMLADICDCILFNTKNTKHMILIKHILSLKTHILNIKIIKMLINF